MKFKEHSIVYSSVPIVVGDIGYDELIPENTLGVVISIHSDTAYTVEFQHDKKIHCVLVNASQIRSDYIFPEKLVPESIAHRNGNAYQFMMLALEQAKGDDAMRAWFHTSGKNEVVFLVNGVQLSFVEVINSIVKIYEDSWDKSVNEAAANIINKKGLDPVLLELEVLKEKVSKIVNLTPSNNYD